MKKKTTLALLVVLAALAQASPAWALNEIIRSYRGVRSLGMGGLVTTTGLYDEALFGNPAMHGQSDTWKISLINVTAEANDHIIKDASKFSKVSGASGSDIFTKVADSGIVGRNEHLRVSNVTGYYAPRFISDQYAFAIGILVNQQTNIMLRSNVDLSIQSYLDAGPAFGVARKFMNDDLTVGVNVRGIYRLAADRDFKTIEFLSGKKLSLSDIGGQGMGVDGDIGAYYKTPLDLKIVRFSVGGSVNNLAASRYDVAFKNLVKKVTSAPPSNDRKANLGVRADFSDLFILTENKAAVEVQDIGKSSKLVSLWKRVHMGAETRLIRLFSVRAGLNQGYYTAGLGLNLPLLKIDLATYGEEIGTNAGMLEDRRYVARLGIEI